MDVVTAMVLGSVVGPVCELLVKRDIRTVFKGFQVFFNGIGSSFANVVSLLVCADVFAQGLQVIGAVGYMIDLGARCGIRHQCDGRHHDLDGWCDRDDYRLRCCGFLCILGLAPGIATKFGVGAVTIVLPMQLMAGMGRAISPVSGVIIAVTKAGECSPFEIVGRTIIPSIGGIVTMILINYLRNG